MLHEKHIDVFTNCLRMNEEAKIKTTAVVSMNVYSFILRSVCFVSTNSFSHVALKRLCFTIANYENYMSLAGSYSQQLCVDFQVSVLVDYL